MVTTKEVQDQFHRLGVKPTFWAKAEIKELSNVLVPGEQMSAVVFGWYENGFALLTCTDQRVLLLDKKPFFLKMEDLRYDKISEIKFLSRLLDSTVVLSYAGQTLEFKSWNQRPLRKLMAYVQQAIMVINQQQWNLTSSQNPRPNPIPPETIYDQPPVAQQTSEEPRQLWPATETQSAGMSYELAAYPDDLIRRASADLGIMKNPYAPTNKYLRRRVPRFGFNQTSR